MELREPPKSPAKPPADGLARLLLLANLLLLAVVGGILLLRGSAGGSPEQAAHAERLREVAAKLKAAGALDEAARQYEAYLAAADAGGEARARVAYSLGTTYMDRGLYEKALRWLYEAESLGAGDLGEDVGKKIVHSLERLGRYHAAKAALDQRVRLSPAAGGGEDEVQRSAADPVVARIGPREIHRSELDRALDDLPPELAASLGGEHRDEFLRKYVADELLWNKAVKLEYDQDPELRRRHAQLLRQLAVNRFVEEEVVGKIQVDEVDLKSFFEAERERWAQPAEDGTPGDPQAVKFEEIRPLVERDYRLSKVQAAYGELIESELAAEAVELFPERWADSG